MRLVVAAVGGVAAVFGLLAVSTAQNALGELRVARDWPQANARIEAVRITRETARFGATYALDVSLPQADIQDVTINRGTRIGHVVPAVGHDLAVHVDPANPRNIRAVESSDGGWALLGVTIAISIGALVSAAMAVKLSRMFGVWPSARGRL